MNCPDLNSIRIALFEICQNALQREIEAGLVYLSAPNQKNNPDLRCIIVATSFSPAKIDRGEIGSHGSLSKRPGIFKITISSLQEEDADIPWDIAFTLERVFSWYSCESLYVSENEEEGAVYCDFPYTENIGIGPDNRNTITVTVPWWVWTQN